MFELTLDESQVLVFPLCCGLSLGLKTAALPALAGMVGSAVLASHVSLSGRGGLIVPLAVGVFLVAAIALPIDVFGDRRRRSAR
jgi:hypothetical protein